MAKTTAETIATTTVSSPLQSFLTPGPIRDFHIPTVVAFLVAALVLVLAIHSLMGSRTYTPRIKHLLYITLACNLAFSLGYFFLGCVYIDIARVWLVHLDKLSAPTPQQVADLGFDLRGSPVYVALFTSAQSFIFGAFFASGFSDAAFLWIIRSSLLRGSIIPGAHAVPMTLGVCIAGIVLGCGGYLLSWFTACDSYQLCFVEWYYALFGCLMVIIFPLLVAAEITIRRTRNRIYSMRQQEISDGLLCGRSDERAIQLLEAQDRTIVELVMPLRGYPLTYVFVGLLFVMYVLRFLPTQLPSQCCAPIWARNEFPLFYLHNFWRFSMWWHHFPLLHPPNIRCHRYCTS